MNVSSSLHKVPTAFNFDDPSYDKGGYTLFGAYAQVKITMVEGAHHHHPNPKRMSVIHHIQNPPTHKSHQQPTEQARQRALHRRAPAPHPGPPAGEAPHQPPQRQPPGPDGQRRAPGERADGGKCAIVFVNGLCRFGFLFSLCTPRNPSPGPPTYTPKTKQTNTHAQVTRNMPPLLYWGQRLCSPLFLLYQKTPPLGAYTTVHVATAPELRCVGGQYFVNSRATEDVNPLARDPAVGERLWAESERACGLLVDGDGEGGVGNGNGNGSGNGGSGTPARRRRRKDSVDGSGSGGKKGGGGSGASTPQRRRSGLRRSGSKGKLMS